MKSKLVDIDPLVASMNFDSIVWKIIDSDKSLSKKEVRNSVEQYKKFLSLKRKYPDSTLVPTREIDSVWHAHILDTKNYADDCNMLFGKFMHHKPYFGQFSDESQDEMSSFYDQTSDLWEKEFGEKLEQPEIFRCAGKACHAPTPCRCR